MLEITPLEVMESSEDWPEAPWVYDAEPPYVPVVSNVVVKPTEFADATEPTVGDVVSEEGVTVRV